MTRSYSALLACLALSVACASKSKGSDNPDAAVAEARSAAALLGRTLGGRIEIGVGIAGRR